MLPIEPVGLEAIFDAVDLGLVVLDAGMRVLTWNGWMEAATGKPAAAVAQLRFDEIFPDHVNARLASAIADALSAGSSSILSHSLHTAVFPLRTRTGRTLIHNVAVRPLSGQVPRCLVQVSDVTVAVMRDHMLRERQSARYDAVADSAVDAILTLDARGRVVLANPAATNELGYGAHELADFPLAALFDAQPAWDEAWRTLRAGGRLAQPIELVARKKDGSTSFVEISAAAWRSDARIFVAVILRNVNERHRADHALRNLNQTLEQRVAAQIADRNRMWRLSSDAMLVARPDGTINASNPVWQELFGQAGMRPGPPRLGDSVLAEDQPKLEVILRELGHSRAHGHFELRHEARDGTIRWISWNAVAADDLLHAVGRDVTPEREAEHALQAAEEALRQSQKMEVIGQLTGGIAHDFNNLLTGISGSLQLLEARLAQERYGELGRYIDTAKRSANRAAALTHRLLAFSRRQTLDPKPTNMNRLTGDMDDLLRRTVGPTVEVRTRLDPAIGSTLVDSNQLENALLNLCINARDAMPDGGQLTIETANVRLDTLAARKCDVPPGDYVTLCVRDTGSGMPEAVIERAFDPFFTTKPLGEGTGLGLSMVYGFVRQSGGQATIFSNVGQGTSVQLYLPRHDEDEQTEAQSAELSNMPRTQHGETVLVVDDEASVRMLVMEVLEEFGYSAIEAADGAAALRHLQTRRDIDLLVTDVGLPGGINGRQLADTARALQPRLKVLFITGYAANTAAGQLNAGMHVLTKPFAIDTLASKIQEILAES